MEKKSSTLVLQTDDENRQFKVNVEQPSFLQYNKRKILIIVGVVAVVVLVLIAILVAVLVSKNAASTNKNQGTNTFKRYPVILVSMDGFRDIYLDRGVSPNIQQLAQNGVRAKFLISQFPTKTFPNHYSIITGLYPIHHGIVSNRFYDPDLKDTFALGKPNILESKWWNGEPLWQTAMKNGLVAASYFFVGSEVEIQGMRPNFSYYYNSSHPFEVRVDQVLSWLDLPPRGSKVHPEKDDGKRRPDFITLYFNQPDKAGHYYGPYSKQVNDSIRYVDEMIGKLYDGLKARSLQDEVNIILVSDHGMAATDCKRVTYLDQYGVTLDDILTVDYYGGAFMSLSPKPDGSLNKSEVLSRLQCKSRHVQVFAKEELPKRLHYSVSRRIGDIVVIPNEGWLVGTNTSQRCYSGGTHGYDPMTASMRSIFVAHGPSFKKGLVYDPFSNVEIYNMITDILGIEPAKNDGTPGSLHHLLDDSVKVRTSSDKKGDGNSFSACPYPSQSVAISRRRCKDCVCEYCALGKDPDAVAHLDELLDLNEEQISSYQKHNLPWGLVEGGAGIGGCILTQKEYITGFSTFLRVPLWVGYRLDGEKAKQTTPRQNCFRRDVRLDDTQASLCKHYKYSGMDRGHLVPKADLDHNATTALNTFLFTNIAPQYHLFNRVDWANLEEYFRELAINYNTTYVITGSIFDANADGLRDKDSSVTRWLKNQTNTVAIPTHFYKIAVRCDVTKQPYYEVPGCSGRLDVMAFILPHRKDRRCWLHSFNDYLLENRATVRDVERLTGSVFFSGLPPFEQARLKTIIPLELW